MIYEIFGCGLCSPNSLYPNVRLGIEIDIRLQIVNQHIKNLNKYIMRMKLIPYTAITNVGVRFFKLSLDLTFQEPEVWLVFCPNVMPSLAKCWNSWMKPPMFGESRKSFCFISEATSASKVSRRRCVEWLNVAFIAFCRPSK